MATASQYPTPVMSSWRLRLLRLFLWISVLGWGIGLGAKLFDLLVLAGAWSAAPPASLAFLPYGSHWKRCLTFLLGRSTMDHRPSDLCRRWRILDESRGSA